MQKNLTNIILKSWAFACSISLKISLFSLGRLKPAPNLFGAGQVWGRFKPGLGHCPPQTCKPCSVYVVFSYSTSFSLSVLQRLLYMTPHMPLFLISYLISVCLQDHISWNWDKLQRSVEMTSEDLIIKTYCTLYYLAHI